MIEKILKKSKNKKYPAVYHSQDHIAYLNEEKGWTDHFISEKIVFSHRTTSFSQPELFERLHFHDYYELIISATEKRIEYISDGRSFILTKGSAVLTKPMQHHMFRIDEKAIYDRYVIYFKNPQDILKDSLLMDFINMGSDASAVFELADQELLSCMQNANRLLTEKCQKYSSIEAYLEICRVFLMLSKSGALDANQKSIPASPQNIQEIKKYIDGNFLNIKSVSQLSEKFFYSREHISRTFRKYYNTPIYEYVISKKMLYCRSLLMCGESVESAALHAGFYNMSNFINLFRKYNGCTPSEFKYSQNNQPQG